MPGIGGLRLGFAGNWGWVERYVFPEFRVLGFLVGADFWIWSLQVCVVDFGILARGYAV